MDPVTLIFILATQPVVQEPLAQLIGKWLINGVLPSYVVNNFPTLTSLIKKKPGVEGILKITYKKAVDRWCSNEGAERAAMRSRFDTYDLLINFIKEDSFESDSIVNELAHLWYDELEHEPIGRWFIQEIKIKEINKLNKESLDQIYTIGRKVDDIRESITAFHTTGSTTFSHNESYIPRLCYFSEEHFSRLAGLDGESLYDLVLCGEKGKHFILLSSPMMGKTTELKELCWKFSQNSHFYPILFELKNQGGLITKDMLPQKDYVETKSIVLVIDAVDEVSEYNYLNQMKELNGYAEKHPNMRIVLSCRSNYRRLINSSNFTVINLGALTSSQVHDIISQKLHGKDPEQFISEIKENGLTELTNSPFFLNNLIDNYNENGSLVAKTIIFDKLVENSYRIEKDKQIIDDSILHNEQRIHLERVACVMLLTGKSKISKADLRKCLGDDAQEFKETLHYGVLNYSEVQDTFEFEYNSIKEYLAASCLSKMLLDKVKTLVCVESSNRIATHWNNTIVLFAEIISLKNGGIMPDDLYNWLKEDNKGLLLHISKQFIKNEDRPKILIDYIKEQNDAQLPIETIGSEGMKSIVSFGMSIELANYLWENFQNVKVINIQFANLVGVSEFLDWNFLRSRYFNLATSLEDVLLSFVNGNLFKEKTEWICTQWINNKSLQNRDFLNKLISRTLGTKSQIVLNYILIVISNLNCADEYYQQIMDLQVNVKGKNGLIGRTNLYRAISKLKDATNVNEAFKIITKSHFYMNDYSMESYREMESDLLKTAKNIYQSGYFDIADTIKSAIKDRFSSHYGFKSTREREQVANKYRQFFIEIGQWEKVSEEVEKYFRSEINEPKPEDLKKRAKIHKKQYNELMNEAEFVGIVKKMIDSPNEISEEELTRKYSESLEAMNQFAYRFVVRHIKKSDDKIFIDKDSVTTAINDRKEYQNYIFDESVDILNNEHNDFTLEPEHIKQICDYANKLIYNLCSEDVSEISRHQIKAIQLMLKGKIKIHNDYLIKLMRFSGRPFITDINELWCEEMAPLFNYIIKHVGDDKVKEFVRNELNDPEKNIDEMNFKVWASYALRMHMTETYESIIQRIIKRPTDMLLLEEQLTSLEPLQEKMVSAAESGDLKCTDFLLSLLDKIHSRTPQFNQRIQSYLESHINIVDSSTLRKLLSILLEMNSIPALDYVAKNPSILENGGIYTFNYYQMESVEKLIYLFDYFADKDIIPNPSQSILKSLFNLAVESKDMQNEIEGKMRNLANSKPNLAPFINKWIMNIKDAFTAKNFLDGGIPNAIDWLDA